MAVNDFIVKNGLFVSTTATILGTRQAVSTSTGALVVKGGVGIGQDLYVGGTIYGYGILAGSVSTATNLTGGLAGQVPYQSSPGNTSFFGPGTAGDVLVSNGSSAPSYNNTLTLASVTSATSTATGALQVRGGAGIGQNLHIGTFLNVQTQSTTATINAKAGNGAVWAEVADFQGGNGGNDNSGAVVYVRNNLYGSGQGGKIYGGRWGTNDRGLRLTGVSFDGTENAYIHLNSEGSLIQLNVGGINRLSIAATGVVTISTVTNASSTSTGALVVNGGAGFGQDVFIGGDLAVNGGDVTSNATTFNLLNATVTTLNFAGAGTNITIGAASGATTIRNAVTLTNTTNATSTQTGALVVTGGVGIGQNLYVGGGLRVTGRFTSTGIADITNTTVATNTLSGALVVAGGVGIGQDLWVGGNIYGSIAATVSTATNVQTQRNANGGTYYLTFVDSDNATPLAEALFTSSTIYFSPTSGLTITNITASSTTQTGALVVSGGAGIGQNLYIGGDLAVNGGDMTSAATTFNLLNSGVTSLNLAGAGTAIVIGATTGATTIRNAVTLTNTTNATSTQTGALQVSGGAGIGQNLYVGGGVQVTGLTTVT
ncbi:MAG: hypothetical protein EBU90_09970, partial [Proteobacteria bacterium]|nr:hypothetical protein [Pseudomonadota bacterium]NBP14914.1 hypothetical protein [bacterium]